MIKLDILALAAHPDDVELCCSGTMIKQARLGYKTGIVDFTKGEMGTRGTPETRMKEAEKSSEIMRLSIRENLEFKDVWFKNDEEHKLEVIKVIRKYKPEVLLINAKDDRHPDHGKAHELSRESAFLAGLKNIKTVVDGQEQEAWRPKVVYSYIQGWFLQPDFIVDVSDFWQEKMDSILAFKSQFHNPDSTEPSTWLSSPEFMDLIKGRAVEFGQAIGGSYGEGFQTLRWAGVDDIMNLK